MNKARPIKVLIVEDTLLTRIGITSICDWEENGFKIIGSAENGREALEMIDRGSPDIILTDIIMPVMGGLELLRELKSKGSKTRFIMLSAYNDFALVREALQLGADDYLLKMEMESDSILRPFLRLAKEIRQEEEHSPQATDPSLAAEDNTSRILCELLSMESIDEESKMRFLHKIGYDDSFATLYCLVAFENRESDELVLEKGRIILDQAVLRLISELMREYKIHSSCITKHGYYIVLFSHEAEGASIEGQILQKLCMDIIESVRLTFGLELTVNTKVADDPVNLPSLYNDLCFKAGSKSISLPHNNEPLVFFNEQLSCIESVLSGSHVDLIQDAFDKLIKEILNSKDIFGKQLYGVCHTLIHIVDSFISHNKYLEIFWNRSDEFLFIAKNCQTTNEYMAWITDLSRRITFAASPKNEARIILKAKSYINENYKSDISLESVSQYVNISPSYFSRLFAAKTSVNFIDYLTDVRIDHAKQYLRNTDKKIIEISELVGYSNSYYFSRIFKKTTGMSPVQYRNEN